MVSYKINILKLPSFLMRIKKFALATVIEKECRVRFFSGTDSTFFRCGRALKNSMLK